MGCSDPFLGPPPDEVPLRDAPLVRVIAQLRFPPVLAVEQREFVAPFQEALRQSYPVLRQEQTQGLSVGPAGVTLARAQAAWRFHDLGGQWRVSLTPEFVALECTKYTSRSDFFARLRAVLAALDAHVQPKLVDRLGVRYIDRITGPAVEEIASLVRPEVRGVVGTAAAAHVLHAVAETMFDLPGARVLARWGQLPAGATVDPAAIEPAAEKSWILDLDMYGTASRQFDIEQLLGDARNYSERIYAIFRWAVTSAFLERFGGAP
jgi:uncharacterized protein (TIGR04255 family)